MLTIEYKTTDKSKWGDGPWQDEPDKKQWMDEATGLPCMIRRGPSGSWCGYVGIDKSHPMFEQHYHDPDVEVHGGLTFAGACNLEGEVESGICHTVEENENDNIWWFGFDCAHGGDHMPAFRAQIDHINACILQTKSYNAEMTEKLLSPMQHSFTGKYRDINYVTKETLSLAQQLHGMQPNA